MAADMSINEKSYCKMILHSIKYPHCTVNGLLLAEKAKTKDSKVFPIVDCVPLFHIGFGLTPMIEVALTQVDLYCKDKGLVIAGYYQANGNSNEIGPNHFAIKIIEKIQENLNSGEVILVMIDNEKLSLKCKDVALRIYQGAEGKWKLKENASIHVDKKDKTFNVLSKLLRDKRHQVLIDFDNHLDNVALSWENFSLNEQITELLTSVK